ncbi:hypothetical protein CC78DRAFT_574330 [Lojkania enalia]|uniref:Uncharacterized protein n=1 Tax=Lojkania enalia TaxID=147567 RepID=A0A9P4TPS5_9PLEO|nr:hypothetical protein CC78DRAFT_574330 [Didymosphaeria enalia]
MTPPPDVPFLGSTTVGQNVLEVVRITTAIASPLQPNPAHSTTFPACEDAKLSIPTSNHDPLASPDVPLQPELVKTALLSLPSFT